MSEPAPEFLIRRILVALDTSPHGRAALETAAELAAELSAELQGLFVEDDDLLRLAGLPFAQEIGYSSALPRRLEVSSVERSLRAKAEAIRRQLALHANSRRLPWSFEVLRGRVVRRALAAVTEDDLLILCREGPSRPASDPPAHSAGVCPLLVVYDGSAGSQRALLAAARLCRGQRQEVVVLVVSRDHANANNVAQQALQWLERHGVQASAHDHEVSDMNSLIVGARQHFPSLVILNRASDFLDESGVEALVRELECPVALVR